MLKKNQNVPEIDIFQINQTKFRHVRQNLVKIQTNLEHPEIQTSLEKNQTNLEPPGSLMTVPLASHPVCSPALSILQKNSMVLVRPSGRARSIRAVIFGKFRRDFEAFRGVCASEPLILKKNIGTLLVQERFSVRNCNFGQVNTREISSEH